jgi:hypothetical protein
MIGGTLVSLSASETFFTARFEFRKWMKQKQLARRTSSELATYAILVYDAVDPPSTTLPEPPQLCST